MDGPPHSPCPSSTSFSSSHMPSPELYPVRLQEVKLNNILFVPNYNSPTYLCCSSCSLYETRLELNTLLTRKTGSMPVNREGHCDSSTLTEFCVTKNNNKLSVPSDMSCHYLTAAAMLLCKSIYIRDKERSEFCSGLVCLDDLSRPPRTPPSCRNTSGSPMCIRCMEMLPCLLALPPRLLSTASLSLSLRLCHARYKLSCSLTLFP